MSVPLTGQAVCTGASNAVALSVTPVISQGFTIKAPLTNALAVCIGPSNVTSTTGYQLDPGAEVTYARNAQVGSSSYQLEPSDFYVAGTAPDKVTWLASP